MTCLYDPNTAPETNARGRSPMQHTCTKRLHGGRERLLHGIDAGDMKKVRIALDEIGPLLACQFRNALLPCAQACYRATNAVSLEFQDMVAN